MHKLHEGRSLLSFTPLKLNTESLVAKFRAPKYELRSRFSNCQGGRDDGDGAVQ